MGSGREPTMNDPCSSLLSVYRNFDLTAIESGLSLHVITFFLGTINMSQDGCYKTKKPFSFSDFRLEMWRVNDWTLKNELDFD